MQHIAGYTVNETLSVSSRSTVYRGHRTSDGVPVVLKVLSSATPSYDDLGRFFFSFQLTEQLSIPGVIRPIELIEHEQRPVQVFEDIGGISLRKMIEQGALSAKIALPLFIRITEVLDLLHRQYYIHKDIKPANIFVAPDTHEIQIGDFEFASQMVRETALASRVERLEGTLAYISPEQTGRMNRTIDHRSDLYSLGVSMYEVLVGELPFPESDVMSMVHSHIAVAPPSPHLQTTTVPLQISKIIRRLMAKTPEERYQSAWGVKCDLERCLKSLSQTGTIELFPLGQDDISPQFQLSQKLYGREQEVHTMLEVCKEATEGDARLLLISGYSGVGKSALVRELYKPIVASRSRFAKGKYDPFQNAPYTAIAQAFSSLLEPILAASERRIEMWREAIQEAVGQQGQLIIDILPEVETLIGPQAPVPPMPPTQAQNRLNQLFSRFIRAFISPERPLVLFLDDLQWADSTSLDLIKSWLTDAEMHSLFVIGAYRSNEVSIGHPLLALAEELRESTPQYIAELELQPLLPEDVISLIADTVRRTREEVTQFADTVLQKTRGNPFFIERFLFAIHERDILVLNPEQHRWDWDLEAIEHVEIADNVAELMAAEIRQLPDNARTILQWASCMGNSFDLHLLSTLTNSSLVEISEALEPVFKEQMVTPVGEQYRWIRALSCTEHDIPLKQPILLRFVHDRVQEGAYSLLEPQQRVEYHCRIAELLYQPYAQSGATLTSDTLFELVNHFNIGFQEEHIDAEQRDLLIRLNLEAGERAIEASAWQAAFEYLERGMHLLPEQIWTEDPKRALAFYSSCAISAMMTASFDRCVELEDAILNNTSERDALMTMYRVRLSRAALTSQHALAFETALQSAELFDFERPKSEEEWGAATGAEFVAMEEALAGRDIRALLDAPIMTDSEVEKEVRLLVEIAPVAMAMPHYFPLQVTRLTRLCLEHGMCSAGAVGFVYYAALCAILGDFEKADAFGELGLALNEKFGDTSLRTPMDHTYGSFVSHWMHPFEVGIRHCAVASASGLEHGIFDSASWAAMNEAGLLLADGVCLAEVVKRIDYLTELCRNAFKYDDIVHYLMCVKHFLLHLTYDTEAKKKLSEQRTEDELMESLSHYGMALGWLRSIRAQYACILRQFDVLLIDVEQAFQELALLPCSFTIPEYRFYVSMTYFSTIREVDEETRAGYLTQLHETDTLFQAWSKNAPENYRAKHLLMQAEQAALDERYTEAMELFDAAILCAQTSKLQHIEAMALEATARFYLRRDQSRMARGYLYDARYAYLHWGALAKVRQLEDEFSVLHSTEIGLSMSTGSVGSSSSGDAFFDIQAIQNAVQTLSRTIILEDVLKQLMEIVIKHAGAQKGALLLQNRTELVLEAVYDAEDEAPSVLQSIPLDDAQLALSVVRYVQRTHQQLVLGNAVQDERFGRDAYIQTIQPLSILCLPILNKTKLIGLLYLENRHVTQAFTPSLCSTLEILGAQAAISIEIAVLYNQMEEKVAERTFALQQALGQLEHKHAQLQNTQAQLVQSEKMASLGTLVAGVAHELNNPANFSLSGAQNLQRRISDLQALLLELVGEDADPEILELFGSRFKPIFENVKAVKEGSERIKEIVLDLRTFSRLDEAEHKSSNVVEGLRATLALIAANTSEEMEIISNYVPVPDILCWAAELNQVFMNIVVNAHHAILDKAQEKDDYTRGTLRVQVRIVENQTIEIEFQDDGCGMSEEVASKVFEPFFTTRPVGSGTGLGMSTSLSIIQKHKGTLKLSSVLGEGTCVRVRLPID